MKKLTYMYSTLGDHKEIYAKELYTCRFNFSTNEKLMTPLYTFKDVSMVFKVIISDSDSLLELVNNLMTPTILVFENLGVEVRLPSQRRCSPIHFVCILLIRQCRTIKQCNAVNLWTNTDMLLHNQH